MVLLVQKMNRLRLAGMGLTQIVWSADWMRWAEGVQTKREQVQAEAMEAGKTFFAAHAIPRSFAFRPLYQAVGAVDLVWGAGRKLFDELVCEGVSAQQVSGAGEPRQKRANGQSKTPSRKRKAVAKGKKVIKSKVTAKSEAATKKKVSVARKSVKPKAVSQGKKVATETVAARGAKRTTQKTQ